MSQACHHCPRGRASQPRSREHDAAAFGLRPPTQRLMSWVRRQRLPVSSSPCVDVDQGSWNHRLAGGAYQSRAQALPCGGRAAVSPAPPLGSRSPVRSWHRRLSNATLRGCGSCSNHSFATQCFHKSCTSDGSSTGQPSNFVGIPPPRRRSGLQLGGDGRAGNQRPAAPLHGKAGSAATTGRPGVA
jgi:hypothetical protein